MENKNIFILASAVVALAGLAAFLYWQNGRPETVPVHIEQPSSTVQTGGERMSVVPASQSDNFYSIQAEYPQFEDADPAFNQKIADLVKGQIENFKKEAKENFNARNATMPKGEPVLQEPEQPFDFIATWTQDQSSPGYLSFVFDIYYFSGGAHGIDQIFAFNYDLANKKEIIISDLLGSTESLGKLSKMAQDQVSAQLQSNGMEADGSIDQMIQEGTKPVSDNYRNFTFGSDKLTLYFEQYQAAPGAAGTITVVFSKDDLERNGISSDYLK
ncbi:MAG: DUF3298 and DUF4163 domain-containing protein [Candidatus Paceibacterota bacterium]|jgi:hypothetical protein